VAEGVIGILPLVCQSLDQALLLVDALFRSSNVLIGFGNIRNHIKSGPGVGRLPKLPRMHTLAHRLRRDVAMSTLDPELNDFGAHSRFTPGKLAKDEPLHQLIPLAEFAFNTAGRENAATMNAGLAYVDTWRVAARSNRSAQQRRRAKLQALTTVLPTQRRPARSRKNSRREGSRPQRSAALLACASATKRYLRALGTACACAAARRRPAVMIGEVRGARVLPKLPLKGQSDARNLERQGA
jgi:hypothetical protein